MDNSTSRYESRFAGPAPPFHVPAERERSSWRWTKSTPDRGQTFVELCSGCTISSACVFCAAYTWTVRSTVIFVTAVDRK